MLLQVVDNFLPAGFADDIEKICKEMPWYLEENISGRDRSDVFAEEANIEESQYGFYHLILGESGTSQYFDKISPILYFIQEKTGIVPKEIYRIRLALSTSINKDVQHYPHADMDFPHKVLLYYVNDSDGDTFMYNEVYSEYSQSPKNFTINQRISPKKNRAVIFDGLRYHSSSKPNKYPTRFIINVDFN